MRVEGGSVCVCVCVTSLKAKEVRLTDESVGLSWAKVFDFCGDFVEKVNGQFVGDFEWLPRLPRLDRLPRDCA